MTLKNSFHTQLAIGILLQDEESLDAKLGLLTEISLTATSPETFKICEEFRERLCNQEKAQGGPHDIHLAKTGRDIPGSSGNEESPGMDEVE